MKRSSVTVAGVFGVVLIATTAAAQTTQATAANYVIGQGWVKYLAPGDGHGLKWYRFGVFAGRSYCLENVPSDFLSDPADTFSVVQRGTSGGGAQLGFNDQMNTEPGAITAATGVTQPSRVCWVAPATEDEFAYLFTQEAGVSFERKFRIVDTTLFSPWFFSASGFEAFILIKNTTAQAIIAYVTLYSATGVALGAQSASVPANGSYNLQVSAAPPSGFSLNSHSGTVQIAHTGANGALFASVTSLNFSSGVSFDAPVSPRLDGQQ